MEAVKMIGIKLDRDKDRFVRNLAKKEGRTVTSVVSESVDFFWARTVIEERIRASVYSNRSKYRDWEEMKKDLFHPDAPPRMWKAALTRVDDVEEWVHTETFNALREFSKRGRDWKWLQYAVLDAEYYVPFYAEQEEIPFADANKAPDALPVAPPAKKRAEHGARKADATA